MSSNQTLKGKVQAYLLNVDGEVDGLLLDGGRQLKVPPRFSKELASRVAIGSTIEADVRAGEKSAYGQEFELRRWLDENRAHKTVGEIQQWLVNKDGDVRGFIVSEGTQIHIPKHLRKETVAGLQIGSKVTIHGHGYNTSHGAVYKADEVLVEQAVHAKI